MTGEREDLSGLLAGNKAAWDSFVARFAGLILAAVRRVVGSDGIDVEDIAQDVFVRLCKNDFRLLRQYDPTRAGLSTWLTIVSRSVAHDTLRRRRPQTQTIDVTPEAAFAVEPSITEKVKIPDGLLSPRQQLVLTMLYERDMEVAEIAAMLSIDAQTVRSTHHKAMLKLRAHFGEKP
ncbi:MAG TPA: sigma-70 family RNA polymerase sigma factor [Aliidongia sp.]|uniref:RNA polymerase sigma factor n=1 Tax=Aliidongia sp. TaxID=1914230 RepID=UPI002DDD7D86|nr:sigma-70 family RNA polymerase sigma factor [Aliidongia sp.]HEV2673574.1 sigma-70 family RNA polymerase sigma factor [Aliidongia sp.]